MPPKVPQNRYSALRSLINCKTQPKRVNSVLRTLDNTRLVIVSLTLMAHFVKSTKNKIFCHSEFISFIYVVLNECEGPHCHSHQNFLITCLKRFFASAQNDEKSFTPSGSYQCGHLIITSPHSSLVTTHLLNHLITQSLNHFS